MRVFELNMLSQHIVFGKYIHLKEEQDDCDKSFAKYADLQLQLPATTSTAHYEFGFDVTEIPPLGTYQEATKAAGAEERNGASEL